MLWVAVNNLDSAEFVQHNINLFIFFVQGVSLPMATATQHKLLSYLQEELAISADAIEMAIRQREHDPGPLPMILWKYGLVSLEQLDKIYDWLATA
jgi:hypothetical protein